MSKHEIRNKLNDLQRVLSRQEAKLEEIKDATYFEIAEDGRCPKCNGWSCQECDSTGRLAVFNQMQVCLQTACLIHAWQHKYEKAPPDVGVTLRHPDNWRRTKVMSSVGKTVQHALTKAKLPFDKDNQMVVMSMAGSPSEVSSYDPKSIKFKKEGQYYVTVQERY